MKSVTRIATFVLLSMTIFGCATVPKESVELSAELTTMIRSARVAHLALVDQYLQQRQERIDEFMEKTWIPRFMEHAFKDTKIFDMLSAVSDPKEKESLLREFQGDVSIEIQKRRTSLVSAVDEIGISLRDAISSHYDDMLTINQALTSHLQSAADITEIRQTLLSRLGVNQKKLLPLDKINGVLENVLKYETNADDINEAINKAKSYILEK